MSQEPVFPEKSASVDDVINDLVQDFGTAGQPFDYDYWAEQTELGLKLDLPGFEPHDPAFWEAVIVEMRRRSRVQNAS